jgi:serine/threonine protein kinase
MINQYVILKTLGKGSFATVLLCKDTISHEMFAVKKMNKKLLKLKSCGNGKSAYDCVVEELKLLKRLKHPNVIWLHEIIDDQKKDHIYLVTEWLKKGTLGDLVAQKNKIFESHNADAKRDDRLEDIKTVGLAHNNIRFYFIDLLKALNYCHKVAKIIHRDIKPDNIGINHNGEAVLIDFGVSADVEHTTDDTLEENMGSYMFFAPEMF